MCISVHCKWFQIWWRFVYWYDTITCTWVRNKNVITYRINIKEMYFLLSKCQHFYNMLFQPSHWWWEKRLPLKWQNTWLLENYRCCQGIGKLSLRITQNTLTSIIGIYRSNLLFIFRINIYLDFMTRELLPFGPFIKPHKCLTDH